jgi:DNA-binding SARP family transcriptional activator/tetratricopeptide (TPR) repeat protein
VYRGQGLRTRIEVQGAEIRVLGPFEVVVGGHQIDVGGPRPRALLAVLASAGGRPVSVPTLVDQLWSDREPPDAARTVRTYVSRLRRALRDGAGADELIATRPPGYALPLESDAVDAGRFERLAADGRRALREGKPGPAAERLAGALGLWRGDAYAEFADVPALAAEGSRLERLRLTAMEDRVEADLAVGLGAELIAELETLIGRHPGHERLWGQLMTALYRAGRQADALSTYQRARAALVEVSGVEPSPALQAMQRQVLDQDPCLLPAPAPVTAAPPDPADGARPAQLTPPIAAFSGRAGQLAVLDSLPDAAAHGMPIAVIAGVAGVGKTALAVHWASRVRDRFADGQLYVNLRGHAPSAPMQPVEALAGLLPALGVRADKVPADLDRAAALYRTALADRRMLVVLDDARSAEQVRPLLPGSPGSVVVVTSRYGLGGLVARDGAVHVALDPLTAPEADVLLGRMLGRRRVDAEPDATGELARLCGMLPLALRIAAANLTLHPEQSIAAQVAELAMDDRLGRLRVDGDDEHAVRAAFDLSYAALPTPAARLFRLLGLVPGPEFGVELAAALTGADAGSTAPQLAHLVDASLLFRTATDRFAFHDLLRLYAAKRADEVDGPADRAAAIERMLDWYLAGADAGARALYPGKRRLAVPAPPRHAFETEAEALAWLDLERPGLVAAARLAASRPGPGQAAWLLADTLRGYFWLRMCVVDWHAVGAAGLSAAVAAGDLAGQAAAELCLADPYRLQGRFQDAIEHYSRAAEQARAGGWDAGEGIVLTNLGMAYLWLGQLDEAARCWQRRLEIATRTGDRAGAAASLTNLGLLDLSWGELGRAAERHLRAADLQRAIGSRQNEAIALANLAETYQLLGRLGEAHDHLLRALALHREAGDRGAEAESLRILAVVLLDLGEQDRALQVATQAAALAVETGHRPIEAGALNTLGSVRCRLGRYADALADHEQARRLARDTETPHAELVALAGLAACHLRLGHLDRALALAEHVAADATNRDYRIVAGQALTTLLEVHLAAGDPAAAVDNGRRALDLHRGTGHRHGEARTALLLGHALRATDHVAATRSCRDARDLFAALGAPEAADAEALLHKWQAVDSESRARE